MKSEFKGYGRAEKILEDHIPQFDPRLAQKMLIEANVLKEQLQRFVIETEPKPFTIKFLHGETAYWTITFSQPVIQYVPECFRFITKNILYHFSKGKWLEHVPSYIPNINHVTMNTNYNDGNEEFGNNTGGIFAKYTYDKNIPMTFYSFNILMRWYAVKKYLDDSAHDYIKRCFEMYYWRMPTPQNQDDGSCINNLIYASTSKIREIIVLRKTLIKILEIEKRTESRNLLEKNVRGKFAKVLLLTDDGIKITTQQKRIFLLDHIADSLKEQDIINAVLAQIGSREKKIGTVMIGQIGNIVKPNDLQTLVSLILFKLMQNPENFSSPTKIITTEKLQFETTKTLQNNPIFFASMFGWGKDLPKKISSAIENLFPLFFEDAGDIYQLSPAVVSFISTIAPKMLQNKKFVLLIAKLFDTLKMNANFWGRSAITKLRMSDNYGEIQGDYSTFANTLLNITPRLINRIVYSRVLSQHFTHQGP